MVGKQMSLDARREYLQRMRTRYLQASRSEKSVLLDEMEQVTQMHRKSLVRLISGSSLKRQKRRQERRKTYGADVQHVLGIICESFDYPCAERLVGNLGWMAEQLVEHKELPPLSLELREQLDRISRSSIQRRLGQVPKDRYYLKRRPPKSKNEIAANIPIERLPWDESQPGHLEVDLVHHCGSCASGEFAYSLQMVDVATGWSEIVALLGKSQRVVADGCARILARIPFPILQLHPDNGSEFLNHHLLRFWREVVPQLKWSRSRPYQSNDNRFVEQKNSFLIRKMFGQERLDTVAQVNAMNRLFEQLRLYYNLLQPVMRVREKRLGTDRKGRGRVRLIYDQAQTPFERLRATGVLSPEEVAWWEQKRRALNPRKVRQKMNQLAGQIVSLPQAIPTDHTEDVYETMYQPLETLIVR
jgi:hypothetical protein